MPRANPLTRYERAWLMARPFLPALYGLVWRELHAIVKAGDALLDAGGRLSPYTSGLGCRVTIVDLPRRTSAQESLHLGLSLAQVTRAQARRSNVEEVVIADLLDSSLPANAFDVVACVEVLEHVARDEAFVAEIARLLKPGGRLFLTTPNGDYIKNEGSHANPDHLRHYTRAQLADLLQAHLTDVSVRYAVRTGRWRVRGLRSFRLGHPFELCGTLFANAVNGWQSRRVNPGEPRRAAHLVATGRKA